MSKYTAHEQLTELLGLDGVGVKVTGAAMYGVGGAATLTVTLSNGNVLEFDPLRTMMRPQTLLAELGAATGVTPELKQRQCQVALALACSIANRCAYMTEADQARGWGTEYLQGADMLDVDMTAQRDRWGAFLRLAKHDPWTAARETGGSIANHGLVLRDTDNARLVRSGWMLAFVRTIAPRVSHIRLPVLLAQAGWEPPKQFKATNPTRAGETLHWAFYTVPAGWEND